MYGACMADTLLEHGICVDTSDYSCNLIAIVVDWWSSAGIGIKMLEPFKHARYAACFARTEPQIAEPKCSSRQFTTVYGIEVCAMANTVLSSETTPSKSRYAS